MKIGDNNYMFTLKDAAGLAGQQYKEAVKGSYMLPTAEIADNAARVKSGKHLADAVSSDTGVEGLPAGKLPGHATFSTESPYNIDGFKSAQGGVWTKTGGGWDYTPRGEQLQKPEYMSQLLQYYNRNKGNGIDTISLPKDTMYNNDKLLAKHMEDTYVEPKEREAYEKRLKVYNRNLKENPDAGVVDTKGITDVSVETLATPLKAPAVLRELSDWGRAPKWLDKGSPLVLTPRSVGAAYAADQVTELPAVSPSGLAAKVLDEVTKNRDSKVVPKTMGGIRG